MELILSRRCFSDAPWLTFGTPSPPYAPPSS
jgi:hypothetical protein